MASYTKARRTKLIKKVNVLVKSGTPKTVAIKKAGVSVATFNVWTTGARTNSTVKFDLETTLNEISKTSANLIALKQTLKTQLERVRTLL